ncbi:hypothetical protein P43SY_010676 [Pythium insidiosum]|uniref:Crinkler effector protein N-terminal domain-containing protein n=1 Tax=Pythium insidiosum TaxID=114742 RepID=A0AAD5LQF5_PYTIN|nr:hypothetical protein P43SY_010676 [Pythium insidiosum]
MVTLVCALVGVKGNAFAVDIDASKSVDHLKDKIAVEQKFDFAASKLQLFLVKKGGDTWLESSTDDVKKLKIGEKTALIEALTHEDNELDGEFGLQKVLKDMPEPKTKQIHVLVVVPEVDQEQWDEERARKKARSLTVIEVERMNSIAATLDIDMWQIGGIALNIRHVETDFPAWFYVRKETQDIIKIFNDHLEKKLNTVFVGTPGVGKSMMVVLFAFYMALRQQKRVVLFRKLKKEGFSMLYLDGKNKQYWRSNKASLSDLDELRGQR